MNMNIHAKKIKILNIKICRKKDKSTRKAHFLSIYNVQNLITSFPHPDDVSVLVWSNSSHWLKR